MPVLPLDIEPLFVIPEVELFMPDELPMPELEPELVMPLEVVEPVVEDEPLFGCERSPCDKPGVVVLVEEPRVPIVEPVVPMVEPDCCTGEPSLRELSLPVTGAVVRGAVVVAEGVVAVVPVVLEVPIVPVAPDVEVVPVVPCCACVGLPSLRALSLAVTGAVVLGLVVVADGVVGEVCATARPIEPSRVAAAAAALRRLKAFMGCTP